MKRKVDEYEGRIWAETRGYSYFETSALSGQGIQDMYEVRLHGTVLGSTCVNIIVQFKLYLYSNQGSTASLAC